MTRLGLRRAQPVDLEAITARTIPPDAAFELGILYRLVETMPEKLRTPLILRHLDDASLEDIGRLMGISLATVKRRLNAGQAELSAALARAERGSRSHARG
jgi:DNA-directed RNA polymerase specialized sigma24 family protein